VGNVVEALLLCKKLNLASELDCCILFMGSNKIEPGVSVISSFAADEVGSFYKRFYSGDPIPKLVATVTPLRTILTDIYEKDFFSDFTLISGEEKIKVHRGILYGAWPYFEECFHFFQESGVYDFNTNQSTRLPSEVLRLLVQFFYAGKIELKLEEAVWVLEKSNYYLMKEIFEVPCQNFIKNSVQSNWMKVFLLGIETGNKFTKDLAVRTMPKTVDTQFLLELFCQHLEKSEIQISKLDTHINLQSTQIDMQKTQIESQKTQIESQKTQISKLESQIDLILKRLVKVENAM